MQGIIRAVARLAVMGLVMAAVLTAAVFAGLGATTAIAIAIILTGTVGLVMVTRRPRTASPSEQIAEMLAANPLDPPAPAPRPQTTAVEAMAPPAEVPADPEANMPRWRRPSLLAARHSDPYFAAPAYRVPMRFEGDALVEADVRVVRYAVVPVLDRPDEVMGLQLSDLAQGDEVQVLGQSGGFLEVICANGDQGWVHRTTLGPVLAAAERTHQSTEGDDALSALLTARGLI